MKVRTATERVTGWCAQGDHDRCGRIYEAHYPGKCQCACHAINRAMGGQR